MKKIIALLIALAMVICLAGAVTVLAAEGPDEAGATDTPAVAAPDPVEVPEGEGEDEEIKFIEGLGIAPVPVIVILCLLVGKIVKISPLEDDTIPVIVGAAGGVLGVIGLYVMPDYPAGDILTAISVGVVSGLAATGIHQAVKKIKALKDKGV